LNTQLAVVADISVAVQVTGVVPRLNVDPDAGEQTTLLTPQLSLGMGVSKLTIVDV
jgi:hypothetical protein